MSTITSPLTGRPVQSPSGRLQAWITKDSQTVKLGVLKAPYYIARVHVHVTEAFDSDGSDEIRLGDSTDTDRFFTLTDVSSTGVKTPTLGAGNGYNGTSYTVNAQYVNGGSEPTTGKALVIAEFFRVPTSP